MVGFISEQPHGMMIPYTDLKEKLQIPVTRENKDRLRLAINRNGKEYSCIRGIGYKLADAGTAMPILRHQLRGIDQKRRRASKAYERIIVTFLEKLEPQDQKMALFFGSVFAAVGMAASTGFSKIYGSSQKIYLKEAIPLLPEKVGDSSN